MTELLEPSATAGYQNWRHLVFLHWRVESEQLQALLPSGLTVETFDGSAWLALVPFAMERVRPWWSPPVPGISWFLETNLRTYVRHDSGLSAVWFFSLDANSHIAVTAARTFWNLNYIHCRMQLDQQSGAGTMKFSGQRSRDASHMYSVEVERRISNDSLATAKAGSLEEFLLERYTLLTPSRRGGFHVGKVIHEPYQFSEPNEWECSQTYTTGLFGSSETERPPDHVLYSPGVDVRVTPLQPVSKNKTA